MTFNAKNLSYGMFEIMVHTITALTRNTDPKEPAFLRRLRGEHGNADSARHDRPLARPKKHKISDDDDDEPTYVDGNSQNAISKADYDTLMNPQKPEKDERSGSSSPISQSCQMEKHATMSNDRLEHEVPPSQLVASIGGNSKRRLAKTIGHDGKSAHRSPNENPSVIDSGSISKFKKTVKKTKKMKLSFDEDDGK